MAEENLCKFNKFGFCKFRNNCFRKHFDQKCENGQCDVKSCHLRHPKKCRYFMIYENCKFGEFCKFNHDVLETIRESKQMDDIRKKLDELRNRIIEKEKEITIKDDEIEKLNKQLQKRVSDIEEKNKAIERDLEKLQVENESLRATINTNKKNGEIKEAIEKATVESESEVESSNANSKELYDKLEEDQEINEEIEEIVTKNKCDKCEFIGKSEAGLKIHKTSKHKVSLMKMYRKVGEK